MNEITVLKDKCQLVGYCEIEPDEELSRWLEGSTRLSDAYERMADSKL